MSSMRNTPFQKITSGMWYAAVTVVGNTAATGLSAVALILVSRFLGPERFGWFSVLVALSIMVGKVADLGLNAALVKFAGQSSQESTIKAVIQYVWQFKLMVVGVLALVSFLGYRPMASALGLHEAGWVWWSLLGAIGIVWYEQLVFSLQGLHRFVPAVVVNAIQAATKLCGVLALWMLSAFSAEAALLLFVLAPLTPWLAVRWLLPAFLGSGWNRLHIRNQQLSQQIWGMAKHTAVLSAALAVIENVDLFFVQRFTDQVETGLFAGAWRIALLIMLMGYSLGSVLNPRVSRFKPTDLMKYLQKVALLIAGLGLMYLIVVPLLPWVVLFSIGPEYLAGVPVLTVLLGAAFLMVATVPFTALFYNWDLPWYFSITAAWQIGVIVLGNWWLVPIYGSLAAGYVRVAAQASVFLFTVMLVLWRVRRSRGAAAV